MDGMILTYHSSGEYGHSLAFVGKLPDGDKWVDTNSRPVAWIYRRDIESSKIRVQEIDFVVSLYKCVICGTDKLAWIIAIELHIGMREMYINGCGRVIHDSE
jgi:hypothetical protein